MIVRDRKKLIAFDGNVLSALEAHARTTGTSLRSLIDEAVRDLLRKKSEPIGLKNTLKQSTREPANEDTPVAPKKRKGGYKRRTQSKA